MSNGPIIGQIKKGGITTHPDAQPDPDEGSMPETPHRAAPAGAVPRGQQHQREMNKSVGANPQKAR